MLGRGERDRSVAWVALEVICKLPTRRASLSTYLASYTDGRPTVQRLETQSCQYGANQVLADLLS